MNVAPIHKFTRMARIVKEKKLFSLLLVTLLFVPVFVNAALIPCGGLEDDGRTPQPPCDFNMLLQLVTNIINWIIWISVPVSAGVFAWAGFQMMINADNAGKRKDSIEMMKKVGIGFVFILSAWLIVTTITNTLLNDEFKAAVPVEGVR